MIASSRYISGLFKYLFLLLSFILFCYFASNYKLLIYSLKLDRLYVFLISAAVFLLLYIIRIKTYLLFWQTFFHEITHALFAMITFCSLEHMDVSRSNGSVSYTGRSNWIITLSPYVFPVHTAVLILFSLITRYNLRHIVFHMIAISYSFYLLTLFKDFRLEQPDIKKTGIVFSIFIVVIFNTLVFFFVLFYLQQDVFIFYRVIKRSIDMIISCRLPI